MLTPLELKHNFKMQQEEEKEEEEEEEEGIETLVNDTRTNLPMASPSHVITTRLAGARGSKTISTASLPTLEKLILKIRQIYQLTKDQDILAIWVQMGQIGQQVSLANPHAWELIWERINGDAGGIAEILISIF